MRSKKIVSMGLIVVLAFSLAACGNKVTPSSGSEGNANNEKEEGTVETTEEDTEKEAENGTEETTEETEEETEGEEESTEEDASTALAKNVAITNFTASSQQPTEEWFDEGEHLCVIGMTISNDNDVSCEISPSLQITASTLNNYGEAGTEELTLMQSDKDGIYSPYTNVDLTDIEGYTDDDGQYFSISNYPYLRPVGLAPHETKDVYYYVDEAYVDAHEEPIDFGDQNQITDIQLLDFIAEESAYNYAPVAEWAGTYQFEEYHAPIGGMTNDPTPELKGVFITGTIKNPTSEKWRMATAQFDVLENGHYTLTGAHDAYYLYAQELEYVNAGETVDLVEGGFEDYYESAPAGNKTNVGTDFLMDRFGVMYHEADSLGASYEVIPTLLSYMVDADYQ